MKHRRRREPYRAADRLDDGRLDDGRSRRHATRAVVADTLAELPSIGRRSAETTSSTMRSRPAPRTGTHRSPKPASSEGGADTVSRFGDLLVRAATAADRDRIVALLVRSWGGTSVAAHGTIYEAAGQPAQLAEPGNELAGVLT